MSEKKKNKSAVHLGKLSVKSRIAKAGGVKAFRQKMKELRQIQEDKKLSPEAFSETLANDERLR